MLAGAVVARDPGERRLLWRVLVTVLGGTAALAELDETILGGDVLAVALPDGPLPLAAALHGGARVALAGTPLVGLRLLFFGGVSVVLVAVTVVSRDGS